MTTARGNPYAFVFLIRKVRECKRPSGGCQEPLRLDLAFRTGGWTLPESA
jgi:hypothetical protein